MQNKITVTQSLSLSLSLKCWSLTPTASCVIRRENKNVVYTCCPPVGITLCDKMSLLTGAAHFWRVYWGSGSKDGKLALIYRNITRLSEVWVCKKHLIWYDIYSLNWGFALWQWSVNWYKNMKQTVIYKRRNNTQNNTKKWNTQNRIPTHTTRKQT